MAALFASLSCLAAPLAAQAPPDNASPVIARVQGRPITQMDFDRVAGPYMARLEQQFGGSMTPEVKKLALQNVINELVRRELLVIESQRRGISVDEAETDRILASDPLFQTNGTFDRAKFIEFKVSPNSNYLNLLPKLRELAAAEKLDSLLRVQFTPSRRAVRNEWSKRNARAQFGFLAVSARDVSLDPEATPDEIEAYYRDNAASFERPARARLRYLKIDLPATPESTFVERRDRAMARGREIAASLAGGTAIDSLGDAAGQVLDTGLFDLPVTAVPGLGRDETLDVEITKATEADTLPATVGPVETPTSVVVGLLTEHQPATVPPLAEVMADAKRRADADKRHRLHETELREFYESHRDRYVSPRATVVRASVSDLGFRVRSPSSNDIRRWYRDHGHTLFPALASDAELPVLDDSLRFAISRRMEDDARRERARRQLERLASGWQRGQDVDRLARSAKAELETLTVVTGTSTDPIFPARYLAELLTSEETARPGEVQGPESFGGWAVVWKVESLEREYVPPFDSLRAKIEDDVRRDRQQKDEDEARVYFDAHRKEYPTGERWSIEYIAHGVPAPTTITLAPGEVEAYYQSHLDQYVQQEQVHARHILISSDPTRTPGGEAAAKARVDSLRAALVAGADFAELARQFSQDPGSAAKGGDLGFFGRGRMVKEFSDTSFALPVGRVSQPVKTTYGYHLIEVLERQPAGHRPLDEVRADIERELKQARADSTALEDAKASIDQLDRGVVAAAVAAPHGGIVATKPFAKNEVVPDLGIVEGLADRIETLPVGRWDDRPYKAGNNYLVLRVTQRFEPGLAAFDDVKYRVVQDMKTAKRDSVLDVRAAAIQRQVKAGASLDSLAAPYGGLKDSGMLAKSATFIPYLGNEPRVIARAFDLAPGAVSDSIRTAQGYVWIRVESQGAGQGASFDRDRESLTQQMLLEKYNEWLEREKKSVRIDILRDDLKPSPAAGG